MSKTIVITGATLHLPLEPLLEAVGPEIVRVIAERNVRRMDTPAIRPPILALRDAVDRLSNALTKYERARHTSGEREMLDALIVAATGVRSANTKLKETRK